MTKLLLATNNKGKIHEYLNLLQGLPFNLVTPASEGLRIDVAETGCTFAENAQIKAVAYSQASGLMTLADDSGLEVDALNGEPGILSSRYAGEGATDEDRIRFLLAKLKNVPWEKRQAHFTCVIAITAHDCSLHFCRGECHGMIALEPSGSQGFGYDPVFYFPELQKTMAELTMDIKNSLSHRARAALAARGILTQILT